MNVDFASVSYSNSLNSKNSHNVMLLMCPQIKILFGDSFQVSMFLS
jgi:hypothetical protein